MCKYCDTASNDWNTNKFEINLGALGLYELDLGVCQRGVMEIDFGRDNEDPLISMDTQITYCPYCGEKLRGVAKEYTKEANSFYYIFKDGKTVGRVGDYDTAIDMIRGYQKYETHPLLKAEFSIIKGGPEEFVAYK